MVVLGVPHFASISVRVVRACSAKPLEGHLISGGDLQIETTTIAKARVKSVALEAMELLLGAFRSDVCPNRFWCLQ